MPWLTAGTTSPAGELAPLSYQRQPQALRRFILGRIFAPFAPGADLPKIEISYEQIFRIAA